MTEYKIDTRFLGIFGRTKTLSATAIVIHHTCTACAEATRRALRKKDYSTHFEVDRDGTIYQYMSTKHMASHCGSANCHAIGIDVTHPKDADWPDVQLEAVRWLVGFLCRELDIPCEVHRELRGIYPHKALGCTECPQDFPMEIFESL